MATYSTRLLVLGVTQLFGPAHGYMLLRELNSWNVARWAHVKPGSVYSGLRTLVKEGFVSQHDGEAGPDSNDRTVYQLTESGEAELVALVRRALADVDSEQRVVATAGVNFMALLPRAEVLELLTERQRKQREVLEVFEQGVHGIDPTPDQVPPHTHESFLFGQAQTLGAIDWTAAALERIRNGAYVFADEGSTWEPSEFDPIWGTRRKRRPGR